VTRLYRPWDAPRLHTRRLPPATLDLETLVLAGGSPQRHALVASLWPPRHDLTTLVLTDGTGGSLAGFVQARRRVDPAEADLIWVAPSLGTGNGAAHSWSRLVAGMCGALGEAGVLRVFASLPADDAVAVQVFRQLGFVVYTEDVVYRLAWGSATGAPNAQTWVTNALPEHELAVAQLVAVGRPEAVAHAEGPADWCTYPLGGRWPRGARQRVWLDAHGTVLGAWHWVTGRTGHWLRVAVAPDVAPVAVLRHALADGAADDRPVFASPRAHEGPLHAALLGEQFEPMVRRARMVKHTAARVLAPGWRRRRLAEPTPDVAASRSAPVPHKMAGPDEAPR
jgi:hypothetical protein